MNVKCFMKLGIVRILRRVRKQGGRDIREEDQWELGHARLGVQQLCMCMPVCARVCEPTLVHTHCPWRGAHATNGSL